MTVLVTPIHASDLDHHRSSRLMVRPTARVAIGPTVPTTTISTTTVPTTTVPAPTVPAPTVPIPTVQAPSTIPTAALPTTVGVPDRPSTRTAAAVHRSAPLYPDLVAKLQAGDRSSWRFVVDRYQGLVCATARRIVPTSADVDEVAQRTWTALWRHADAVRDLDRLAGWLGVTARREALGILRRRREVLVGDVALFDCGARSREQHGRQLWSEASTRSSQDCGALVEHQLQVSDLRAAVRKLPERQRRLVTALLADRMSYDELSVSLGIPRGSIGPMRARALATLRTLLRDWEG